MTTPEVKLAVIAASLQRGDTSVPRLAFADLDALLAPIAGESPGGPSVRYDSLFDLLKDARREEDASLPQGIWSREIKRADWVTVHNIGCEIISHRSKDLQIAAWLLEAWIKLHGFAGARLGFSLLLDLCDQYWDDLHPLPDDGDLTGRISTIEWVNERLPVRLLDVAVTQPAEVDGRAWTWGQRNAAMRQEAMAKRQPAPGSKPPAKGEDWLTLAKFASSAGSTSRAFLVECDEDLAAAIASSRVLQQLLDDRCGTDAPSLTKITAVMTEIRQFIASVLGDRKEEAPVVAPAVTTTVTLAPAVAAGSASSPAAAPPSPLDAVMHQTSVSTGSTDVATARIEAYRKLAEASETLMRIEPHSPTPYLVKRAIAWGGMSLAELMRHFIESGYDLKSLYAMLGMGES
jgi:type VI secretion system protein ImpA